MTNTRKMVLGALLTAMVAVSTMAFQVPIPATKGYINLGDTVIFISALLLGPGYGALAGGIGSAMADLMSPYAAWAPFTLVIKGFEGFLVGYIFYRLLSGRTGIRSRALSMIVGGVWMAAGYFIAEVILYGLPAALVELPGNLIQAGGSAVIALPVVEVMRRINLLKGVI
jgi:uncharacterized membrane protein